MIPDVSLLFMADVIEAGDKRKNDESHVISNTRKQNE